MVRRSIFIRGIIIIIAAIIAFILLDRRVEQKLFECDASVAQGVRRLRRALDLREFAHTQKVAGARVPLCSFDRADHDQRGFLVARSWRLYETAPGGRFVEVEALSPARNR